MENVSIFAVIYFLYFYVESDLLAQKSLLSHYIRAGCGHWSCIHVSYLFSGLRQNYELSFLDSIRMLYYWLSRECLSQNELRRALQTRIEYRRRGRFCWED